jgi:hypothetical protein
LSAWRATGAWPAKYAQWKDERWLPSSPVLLFGVWYVVINLIVVLTLEFIVVGYALVTSGLWGVGAAVETPLRAVYRVVRQGRELR